MQQIFEEMYTFAHEYFSEFNYRNLPRTTDREKLRLLALVYNDELSYFMHHNRITDINKLTNEKVIDILSFCAPIFKNDRKKFIIALDCHRKRVSTMESPRYRRWKVACKASLTNHKYCANCMSTTELELDHIQSRYTNPKKEYNVTNSQYLCNACNQLKSADNVDYRTDEIIEDQWEFINKNYSGNPIIS